MSQHTGIPTTKICYKCKIEKSLDDFYKDRTNALGRQGSCKECQKERNIKYAREHRDYFKKKSRQSYDPSQNKARYLRYRDDYLLRRDAWRSSIRGRLIDLLHNAKRRATKNSLPFDLNIDWALKRFEEQNGTCLLTEIPFILKRGPYKKRFYNPFTPSLDRINPSEGYTQSNTRLVCVIVNLALNCFGEVAFKQMCESYIKVQAKMP